MGFNSEFKGLINEQTIKHFQTLLKDKMWDTVYKSTCINEMYSRIQGIFLRYYDVSFPVFYTNYRSNHNWVTKVSRYHVQRKENPIPYTKNNKDNIQIRNHYKK